MVDVTKMQAERWVEDTADYSWVYKDRDGTIIRANKAITPNGKWWWGYSWSGLAGNVYRSSHLFETAGQAKLAAECLMVSEPA